jgi:hypothetical protein
MTKSLAKQPALNRADTQDGQRCSLDSRTVWAELIAEVLADEILREIQERGTGKHKDRPHSGPPG